MKTINKLLIASVALLGVGLSAIPVDAQAYYRRVVVHNYYYSNYHPCGYSGCNTCGCSSCGYCGRSYLLWPLF